MKAILLSITLGVSLLLTGCGGESSPNSSVSSCGSSKLGDSTFGSTCFN